MKRMVISMFALKIIGLAVFLLIPLRQAQAAFDHCFVSPQGRYCCPGDTDVRCSGATTSLNQMESRERQRLLAAYTAQRNHPRTPNPPRQAPTLRRVSSTGLSVLMLVGGLLMLAKLIAADLAARRRPLRQPLGDTGTPRMKERSVAA